YSYLFRIWWARHKHPLGIREVPASRMAVRDWTPEDVSSRGASDLSHPLFVARKVCLDESGNLLAEGCVYLKGELHLARRESLSIQTQLEAARLIEQAVASDAWRNGLSEIYIVAPSVPDQAESLFRKERIHRGWNRAQGQYWARVTSEKGL
ncbi:MAG: hypothetical protein WB622_06015, partial [Acidobacteriaceae bacterium]